MSAPDPDDELLAGSARLPAGLLAVLGGLAAVLVLVLVMVARQSPRHPAPARAASSAPSLAAPGPEPVPVPVGLPLDGTGEPVVDAVLSGGRLIVMRTDSLVEASPTGRVRTVRHLTGDDAIGNSAPGVRLLIDRTAGLGWAVAIQERQARVLLFDPVSLRPSRLLVNNFVVYDAVLYGGRMYAATSEGIAWLDPSGASAHVPNVGGVVSSLAVDAPRHRLVAVLGRRGSPVIAVTPGGDVTGSTRLGADSAQVRVVDGRIWVAGYSRAGAVLDQLDPRTLRTALRASEATDLSPGAVFIGAGMRDLFVASGEDSRQLTCIDAVTGRRAGVTLISPLSVTAGGGAALAVAAQQLVPLQLARPCVG